MRIARLALPAAIAAAAAAAACDDPPPIASDTFPIDVDRVSGGFVVTLREGAVDRDAVLEVLSPITVFDVPNDEPPARRTADYQLLGHRSATDPALIARAQLHTTVLERRPCTSDDPCTIGEPPQLIQAVIGADALRTRAVRFAPTTSQITFLPDIAGDDPARDRACDAVVPKPFYGGGTLTVGGTEVAFPGLRVALGVCLSPPAEPAPGDPATPATGGTDAALVLSTGLGVSILGEARYEAWRQATGGPTLDSLPTATARLPSGPVTGRLATIDSLAIVGTSTAPRGACRAVYANRLLANHDCRPGEDCPCDSGDVSCSTPSILLVRPPAAIQAIVIPDEDDLLQALRAELRPEQPEIDGILGVDAFDTTELDVDYPDNRLLYRCVGHGCTVRPTYRDRSDRPNIARCVAAAPP